MEKITQLFWQTAIPEEDSVDFAAGFPPYLRGYRAMGYVDDFPKLIPFEDSENKIIKLDNYSQCNVKNLCFYFDVNTTISEDICTVSVKQLLYIAHQLEIGNLSPEKTRIYLSFDSENSWNTVFYIRGLRLLWSEIMRQKNLNFIIPITVPIATISEYIIAIVAQADLLLTKSDNQLFTDKMTLRTVGNSLINRTIDPLGGSEEIEQKTINFYRKSCEILAQLIN